MPLSSRKQLFPARAEQDDMAGHEDRRQMEVEERVAGEVKALAEQVTMSP